jgi:hypothetical protein
VLVVEELAAADDPEVAEDADPAEDPLEVAADVLLEPAPLALLVVVVAGEVLVVLADEAAGVVLAW